MVTNPKNSRFLAPKVEPLQKIRKSSEIRILAFSPFGLKQVQVQINSEQPGKYCAKYFTEPALEECYKKTRKKEYFFMGGENIGVWATKLSDHKNKQYFCAVFLQIVFLYYAHFVKPYRRTVHL